MNIKTSPTCTDGGRHAFMTSSELYGQRFHTVAKCITCQIHAPAKPDALLTAENAYHAMCVDADATDDEVLEATQALHAARADALALGYLDLA